jgi:quercetin dioxygenase-like cupin family protein
MTHSKDIQMPPSSPVQGTTFDIAPIAAEMRGEAAYAREGHTARTLVRETDLRVVLVVMKAGGTIKEHRANETASIHVLTGRVCVGLRDRSVDLPGGRLLMVERGLPHDVEAKEESALLLTLGWHEKV